MFGKFDFSGLQHSTPDTMGLLARLLLVLLLLSLSVSLSLYPAAAEIARQAKWPTCAASDLSFSSSADATAASGWETAGSWAASTEIARVELGSTALVDTHSLLIRAVRNLLGDELLPK